MTYLTIKDGPFGEKPGVYLGDIFTFKLNTDTDYSGKTFRFRFAVTPEDVPTEVFYAYFTGTVQNNTVTMQLGTAYSNRCIEAMNEKIDRGVIRQYLKISITSGTLHNGDISTAAIETLEDFSGYLLADSDNNTGIFYSSSILAIDDATQNYLGNDWLIRYQTLAYYEVKAISLISDFQDASLANRGVTFNTYNVKTITQGSATEASTLRIAGTVDRVEDNACSIIATTADSSKWLSAEFKNNYFIPYTKLTCHFSDYDPQHIEGNFYNNSSPIQPRPFNSLVVQFRYGTSPTTLGNWTTIVAEVTGNSYTAYSGGLPSYQNLYIQFSAKDAFSTVYSSIAVVSPSSLFSWDADDFQFNIPVYAGSAKISTLKTNYIAASGDGVEGPLIQYNYGNGAKDLMIGQFNYNQEQGQTLIYGNDIHMFAHGKVTVNGQEIMASPANNVLWSVEDSAYQGLMPAEETITLSGDISDQKSGIVLVFSQHENDFYSTPAVGINTFFISKKEVELFSGRPHTFIMGLNAAFSNIGAKYLYISDNTITGHTSNTSSGTGASGITFDNGNYSLRYVIGV